MTGLIDTLTEYFSSVHIPRVGLVDVVEILIITFLMYQIMRWIKNTKSWLLLKGIVVIMLFIIFANVFQMKTILWIIENVLSLAVMAIIVVLQPELRRLLEELGRRNVLANFAFFGNTHREDGLFSDKTIDEIVSASFEMSRARTGALIVVEQFYSLSEYERTGIEVDAAISSQLLINIFEHNTPLHDGAVIVRGNRVTSATCYLPLSENLELSKELGTRHRAGIGISEITDAMTVIVSEETGKVSVAYRGMLYRRMDPDGLRKKLEEIQNKPKTEKKTGRFFRKGKAERERKDNA